MTTITLIKRSKPLIFTRSADAVEAWISADDLCSLAGLGGGCEAEFHLLAVIPRLWVERLWADGRGRHSNGAPLLAHDGRVIFALPAMAGSAPAVRFQHVEEPRLRVGTGYLPPNLPYTGGTVTGSSWPVSRSLYQRIGQAATMSGSRRGGTELRVIGHADILKNVSPSLATAASGVDKLLSLTNVTHRHNPAFSMTLSFSADFEQQLLESLNHLWPPALDSAAKDEAEGLLKTSLNLLRQSPLPQLIDGINSTVVQDARRILDMLWQEAEDYRHATMFHVGASTMGVPKDVLNMGLIGASTGLGGMYAVVNPGSTTLTENAQLKMRLQTMEAAQALRFRQNTQIRNIRTVGSKIIGETRRRPGLRSAAGAAGSRVATATTAGAARPSFLRRIAQGTTQGGVKVLKSLVPTTLPDVGRTMAAGGLEYAARSVLPQQEGASHVMQSAALRFASTLLMSRNVQGAAAMAVTEAMYSGVVTYGEALGNFVCDSVITHAMICSAKATEVEKTRKAYADRVASAAKKLRKQLQGHKRGILDSVCTAVADCQAQTFFFLAEQLATNQKANLIHTGGSIPGPVDPAVTHLLARSAAVDASPDVVRTIRDHLSAAEKDIKVWEASSPTDLHYILLQLVRDERVQKHVAERATMLHALTEAVDMRTESGYRSVVETLGLINVQLWWRDDFNPAYTKAVHDVQERGKYRDIKNDSDAIQALLNHYAALLEISDPAKNASLAERAWQGRKQEALATASPEVQAQLSKIEEATKRHKAELQTSKQQRAEISNKILELQQSLANKTFNT